MNKELFSGWQKVFSFTFRQDTKGKFKRSTLIMALIFLLVGMSISIIMAVVEKSASESISPVETVHVINDSDLKEMRYELFAADERDTYPTVSFKEETTDVADVYATLAGCDKDVIIHITNEGIEYSAELIIPEGSSIKESEGKAVLLCFEDVLNAARLLSSDIEPEKLSIALSPVVVEKLIAGEEERSVGEEVMSDILPMMVIMLMYFIILIYGNGMGNAISVEKTSKLMEMMLTMTRPYALILGKITALTSVAVIQILVMFGSFIGGFFMGDAISKSMIYPEYTNPILEVIKLMSEKGAGNAFSFGSIILACIMICVALLMYFLLAATLGSFAEKTEDVPQYMVFFQMATLAGFMTATLLPMKEIAWVNTLLRIVPISAAFVLPGDILVGKISILSGGLYLALMAVFTIILVLIAGKIYINKIFYRGEKRKLGLNND